MLTRRPTNERGLMKLTYPRTHVDAQHAHSASSNAANGLVYLQLGSNVVLLKAFSRYKALMYVTHDRGLLIKKINTIIWME